jgi:methyl-accepting chemotaxis protein
MVASTAKLTTLAHQNKYWWQASYNNGQGKIFFDDRGYDESVGDYVLGVVVPIKENNQIIGILKANVIISEYFNNLNQDFDSNHKGYLQLVRTQGLIVFQEGIEPLSQEVNSNIKEYLTKKGTKAYKISRKDDDYIGIAPVDITLGSDNYAFGGNYSSIDQIKGNLGEAWHIIFTPDQSEMVSVKQEANKYFFYASTFLFIFVGLTIFIFTRLIVKPIKKLSEITLQFGKGKWNQRASESSNDEIGELGKSFNIMAKTVEESQKNLEEKIAKKTKDLEETLEDFYTVRIGMEKDLEKGNLKKENKKIKNRLDQLKNKK